MPRSFEDVREEGGGGGEQGEGPDHRDRDPDPHGDRARLPPTARNVPEAEIKCRVLYCSATPLNLSLNRIVDKIPRKLNFTVVN